MLGGALSSSISTPNLGASTNEAQYSNTMSYFTHEKASTSLNDLEIVRKIVEREGCIEAIAQLLASHSRATKKDLDASRKESSDIAATATLAAAPLVVQSLLEQLRGVSVHIVESIEKWRKVNQTSVFQWRNLNYLLKMIHDLDFLAVHNSTIEHLGAFRGLRLQRNPFLSPIHLDHEALRQDTPEASCRICGVVGATDMKRIFWSSQVLLREENSGDIPGSLESTVAAPVHWSHKEIKANALTMASTQVKATKNEKLNRLSMPSPLRLLDESKDPQVAMEYDLQLSKELIFQQEHELGAMKEELALLQRKVADIITLPSKRLQTRIATLNNEIKLKTGDLFHRRNELHRKEALLRLDTKKREARIIHNNRLKATVKSRELVGSASESSLNGEPDNEFNSDSEIFKMALQDDELRRQVLVERFAAHAKMKAAVSTTKQKLQQLGSPHLHSHSTSIRPNSTQSQFLVKVPSPPSDHEAPKLILPMKLNQMTTNDVSLFVSALNLGDDSAYGSMLHAKGIDGPLLAQATDADLEELGISIRLHRVKILNAIEQFRQ